MFGEERYRQTPTKLYEKKPTKQTKTKPVLPRRFAKYY